MKENLRASAGFLFCTACKLVCKGGAEQKVQPRKGRLFCNEVLQTIKEQQGKRSKAT